MVVVLYVGITLAFGTARMLFQFVHVETVLFGVALFAAPLLGDWEASLVVIVAMHEAPTCQFH
jgi:hypothetical protein